MKEIQAINKISKKVSELTLDDIAQSCEEAGITVGSLCRKLKQLLGASKELKDRDGDGLGVYEDDLNIQYKSMVVGLELLKLLKKEAAVMVGRVEHSISSEDIGRLEAIARELKGLEVRLNADPIQQGVLDAEVIIAREAVPGQ